MYREKLLKEYLPLNRSFYAGPEKKRSTFGLPYTHQVITYLRSQELTRVVKNAFRAVRNQLRRP